MKGTVQTRIRKTALASLLLCSSILFSASWAQEGGEDFDLIVDAVTAAHPDVTAEEIEAMRELHQEFPRANAEQLYWGAQNPEKLRQVIESRKRDPNASPAGSGTGPGMATATADSAALDVSSDEGSECRDIAPSTTDSAIDEWNTPHRVCTPREEAMQNRLLLFFPGTRATPQLYTLISAHAASVGLHAIVLSYSNDVGINLQVCARDPDPECFRDARSEILHGTDSSSHLDVNRANSADNRLVKLLRYLHATYPDQRWEQYLGGEEVRWESVIVAGHSQGAGHAVLVAKERLVDRAIIFSWVDIKQGRFAPWVTAKGQTPADRYYVFWHQGDGAVARYSPMLAEALGLDAFGPVVNVDTASPPYGDSHILTTDVPAPPTTGRGDLFNAHNAIIVDEALDKLPNGNTTFRETWSYLLGSYVPGSRAEFSSGDSSESPAAKDLHDRLARRHARADHAPDKKSRTQTVAGGCQ